MASMINIRIRGISSSSRAIALLFLLLTSGTSRALEGGLNMRWGYDFGYSSPKLVEASQLGFPNDRRSITAGEGEFYMLGFSVTEASHTYFLDASLGIKSATLCDYYYLSTWLDVLWPTCTSDATLNVEFSRLPLELMLAYEGIPRLRLGVGVVYVANPRLRVNSPTANYTIYFDNAPGYVAEFAINISANPRSPFFLGGRYTWLHYEVDGVEVAKAYSAGLFIGFSMR